MAVAVNVRHHARVHVRHHAQLQIRSAKRTKTKKTVWGRVICPLIMLINKRRIGDCYDT